MRTEWVLGTWHATVLMVFLITLLHATGGAATLEGLGTWSGLALFAWLWGLSLVAARAVLRGTHRMRYSNAFVAAALSGLVFVLGVLVVGYLQVALMEGFEATGLVIFIVVPLVASVPAGLLGLLFMLIDDVLLGPSLADHFHPPHHDA